MHVPASATHKIREHTTATKRTEFLLRPCLTFVRVGYLHGSFCSREELQVLKLVSGGHSRPASHIVFWLLKTYTGCYSEAQDTGASSYGIDARTLIRKTFLKRQNLFHVMMHEVLGAKYGKSLNCWRRITASASRERGYVVGLAHRIVILDTALGGAMQPLLTLGILSL
eukprot:4187897-Pleurochrysis_carterae.AAC.1